MFVDSRATAEVVSSYFLQQQLTRPLDVGILFHMTDATTCAHYFVDEAGDLAMFDKRGRSIIGTTGVLHTFMVGATLIEFPAIMALKLNDLRLSLLRDSYFKGVPFMQPEARKTALAFHAKDDVPEVRREVFSLLAKANCQVFVAVRRKRTLLMEAERTFCDTGTKRSDGIVYDDLIARVFIDRLHLAAENRIVFARRGKATRDDALNAAIRQAKQKFDAKWGKGLDRPTRISSSTPSGDHLLAGCRPFPVGAPADG